MAATKKLTHTAAEVDEAIDKVVELDGKIEMVKLWELASVSSGFASQKISLNLTDYDFVLIIVRSKIQSTINQGYFPVILPMGYSDYIGAASSGFSRRKYTVSSTGVTVGGREFVSAYDTNFTASSEDTSGIYPIFIFGLKGVQ